MAWQGWGICLGQICLAYFIRGMGEGYEPFALLGYVERVHRCPFWLFWSKKIDGDSWFTWWFTWWFRVNQGNHIYFQPKIGHLCQNPWLAVT